MSYANRGGGAGDIREPILREPTTMLRGDPMSDAVEKAEQTLVDLQNKRDAVLDHGKQLVQARQEVSFGAYTEA
jgi:hypothetical protein